MHAQQNDQVIIFINIRTNQYTLIEHTLRFGVNVIFFLLMGIGYRSNMQTLQPYIAMRTLDILQVRYASLHNIIALLYHEATEYESKISNKMD